MMMGKDIDVSAILKNNYMDEDKVVQCEAVFMASAVGYNGKLVRVCGSSRKQVELAKGKGTLFIILAFRVQAGSNSVLYMHFFLKN